MSDIHINRGGQNLGTFNSTEVQAGLDSGRFVGSDLAWRSGMENWKPLGQWADFTVPVLPPAVSGLDPAFPPALAGEMNLPSWEQKDQVGFFAGFAATVKEVLTEPAATFSRMKETGGFMTPFLYMLIATGIGAALGMGMQLAMQPVMAAIGAKQDPALGQMFAAQGFGMGTGILAFLIILPIALFIASFLNGGLWHLSLMILGGAKKPFEATYRVYCYVSGSCALVSLVPCCGGIISLVWTVVSGAIGLSKVHDISTGKAVMAVLLPLLVCCGLCGAAIFFMAQAFSGNPEIMEMFNKAMQGQ